MIVVIHCAASKRPDAGHVVNAAGKPIVFVAHPEIAPAENAHVYARPDDASENGRSWRNLLLEYNSRPGNNPLGLLPAYQLYTNGTYGRLVERLGANNVYILSAGWGLIRSDFLTPYYDITFSSSACGGDAYTPQINTGTFACCRTAQMKKLSFLAARTTCRCSVC